MLLISNDAEHWPGNVPSSYETMRTSQFTSPDSTTNSAIFSGFATGILFDSTLEGNVERCLGQPSSVCHDEQTDFCYVVLLYMKGPPSDQKFFGVLILVSHR